MSRHKKINEIELLMVFFRKNHKPSFICDQSKVEFTSCDVTRLLVKAKSHFSQGKVNLSGPVMHIRFQPLWFAILLDLNTRQLTCSDTLQFRFSVVELIEKAERICQAVGTRQIKYSLEEAYFLLLLIEFRLDIYINNICQTISVFSEISHELEPRANSQACVSVNSRAIKVLIELTNRTSVFLTTLFFAKRTNSYNLLQKLLLKKGGVELTEIAPATLKDLKFLSHHGFITYSRKSKFVDIHEVSVFIEGLNPL